jgi:hypothetical protein
MQRLSGSVAAFEVAPQQAPSVHPMRLPLNGDLWRECGLGDRLVCQPSHDPTSRYYGISTRSLTGTFANVRLLDDQHSTVGVGKVRRVGENHILGFIGHPALQRLWVDDFIWINDRSSDGNTRADGHRYAIVSEAVDYKTPKIRRFNQNTGKWAQASVQLKSPNWMRLGNFNVPAERDYFQHLVTTRIDPGFVERLKLPPFEAPPDDPRAYTREAIASLASPSDGTVRQMGRLELSTRYASSFLRYLNWIQSGKRYSHGWQAELIYYGVAVPEIPGSGSGDVRITFIDGKASSPDSGMLSLSKARLEN